MDELFLELLPFGALYYHHIYLYYDEPLIFSCATKAMHYYFFVSIPTLNNCNNAWLMVPISSGRLAKAENNNIEIRNIITESETAVYRIEQSEDKTDFACIDNSELSDDMLPDSGEYLDYCNDFELLPSEHSPAEQAMFERRDIIEFSLERKDSHVRELPCLTAVKAVDNLQNLIYSIANKNYSIRGKIPQKVIDDCQLSLTGMYAASVGFRLKSEELCDINCETTLTPIIRELSQLFEDAKDKNRLEMFLSGQNPRVAYRFKSFLANLIQSNVGIKFDAASPNAFRYSTHYSTQELSECFTLIESEIKEMVEVQSFYGELVGVNVDRSTFEFIPIEGDHIRGKMAENVCKYDFHVPRKANAIIEIRIAQDTVTQVEKYQYLLTEIIFENTVK